MTIRKSAISLAVVTSLSLTCMVAAAQGQADNAPLSDNAAVADVSAAAKAKPKPRQIPELTLGAAGGALVLAIGGLAVVVSRRRRARNA